MAYIIRKSCTTPNKENTLVDLFQNLPTTLIDSCVLTGHDLLITIDTDTTILLEDISSSFAYYRVNNSDDYATIHSSDSEPLITTVICDDNFIYIEFNDNSNRRNYFLYEKLTNNRLLYYYYSSTNASFKDINTFALKDIDTNDIYYHSGIINYNNEVLTLDYTDDYLFLSGVKSIKDSNFIATSNVTPNKIITFNALNYFSLGANVLVKVELT